jgi:hypothetical protein
MPASLSYQPAIVRAVADEIDAQPGRYPHLPN